MAVSALPLRPILARVSRSFYVSLWLLPAATREAVALAYLLARAADTVADTRVVPRAERLRLLEAAAAAHAGTGDPRGLAQDVRALARSGDATEAERALLEEWPGCVDRLEALPALERALARRVLATIVQGMRLDLLRFPAEDAGGLAALETRDELLDYCWHVAGCVGEFWSDLHAARLPSLRRVDRAAWREDGKALGECLQLVNVLRDVPRDLQHGRCYLPRAELASVGLAPRDLLDARAWPRLEPVYRDLVARAVASGRRGLRHVLAAPGRELRLRLAELLPLLLGLRTLGVVLEGNPLDPASRRKVGRSTVWATLGRALLAARDDRAVEGLFRETLRQAGLARRLAQPVRVGVDPAARSAARRGESSAPVGR